MADRLDTLLRQNPSAEAGREQVKQALELVRALSAMGIQAEGYTLGSSYGGRTSVKEAVRSTGGSASRPASPPPTVRRGATG